jgi:hypothetical protein
MTLLCGMCVYTSSSSSRSGGCAAEFFMKQAAVHTALFRAVHLGGVSEYSDMYFGNNLSEQ